MRGKPRYIAASAEGHLDGHLTALMQQYLAGRPGAFRDLYRAIGSNLRVYINELCGKDGQLARRVLKQTFLTIHQTRSSYQAGSDPMQWFRAIADRCFQEHSTACDAPPTARRVRRARRRADPWVAKQPGTLLGRLCQLWRCRIAIGPAEGLAPRPDQGATRRPRLVPT